jgi:acetolactate synthase-1/2/3 large subunit
MTGAEYIAEFLARVGSDRVFLLTGGACAFMIDAVARHPGMRYTCFQHEQSAAMAADAVWRVSRKVGVTMATSGPGATNLITGIACSYFDSIPTIHITGQVNQRESSAFNDIKVRQSGFQETRIVEMVGPITKYAVMVKSGEELKRELAKAYQIALDGRMGPVLLDVPMDVQQEEVGDELIMVPESPAIWRASASEIRALAGSLAEARRLVVLWGGGIAMAGVEQVVADWLGETHLPFVASWAGMGAFSHDHPGYLGQIGVYGNRGANFVLQNADTVLVIGSRLDNRQRSGNVRNFAGNAVVHVIDVDEEELKKYRGDGYRTMRLDLRALPEVLPQLQQYDVSAEWRDYVAEMKQLYFGREISTSARQLNSLSPYDVVRRINALADEDAIVIGDTGACVCWLHQAWHVRRHSIFTAGGNSPMGYALPAAIGAKLETPSRQVLSFNGDGGIQINLQELQTVKHHKLDIAIIIMNNAGYGIIKQFQDSYLGNRYEASSDGYSAPDFKGIARAYGLRYTQIEHIEQLTPKLLTGGAIIIDVVLSEHTLIEPKLEMGRPINDQFPYLSADEYAYGNRFVDYPRSPAAEKA